MNIYNNELSACEKINRPGMGEFYQGTSIKLSEPTMKQKQARRYVPYKGKKNIIGENKKRVKNINDSKLKPSKKREAEQAIAGHSAKDGCPPLDHYRVRASETQIISFLSDCGYSDDVARKCVNSDEVSNCETAIEWCLSYGLNKGCRETVLSPTQSDGAISVPSFNKPIKNDITFREMTTDEPEYDLYSDRPESSKKKFKIGDWVEIYYKPEIMYNLKELGLDYIVNKGYSNKLGYIKKCWRKPIESRRKTFLPVSFTNCNFASVILDDNTTIDFPSMLLIPVKPNWNPIKKSFKGEYVERISSETNDKTQLSKLIKSQEEIIKSQEEIIKSHGEIIKTKKKLFAVKIGSGGFGWHWLAVDTMGLSLMVNPLWAPYKSYIYADLVSWGGGRGRFSLVFGVEKKKVEFVTPYGEEIESLITVHAREIAEQYLADQRREDGDQRRDEAEWDSLGLN